MKQYETESAYLEKKYSGSMENISEIHQRKSTYFGYFSYSETTSTICSIAWLAFKSWEPIVT
jgi:hypothetical protein